VVHEQLRLTRPIDPFPFRITLDPVSFKRAPPAWTALEGKTREARGRESALGRIFHHKNDQALARTIN